MRLLIGGYCDILVMACKWQFLPKWLRASESCRSISSGVVLSVEGNYLLLSFMIFGKAV